MTDADLAFASIGSLGAQLRARAITSLQLVELFLARIARLGTQLNAFITVTADLARLEAKAADADLAAGRDRGPLHGIPYAVKDLVDTAYIATTWGCKAMLDRIPTQDARIITRLRDAGAVLLGKLSMTELANALENKLESSNHGGPCRNPWDPARWTGGSSSGAGAAVAAGLCTFAIGSETWGSIDCPSAFCGLTGYRPTFGTVSRDGALVICPTLDKLGPLARSAADVATVASVIAESAPETPGEGVRRGDLVPGLRIGVAPPAPSALPEYRPALFAALAVLHEAGARVEPVTLPKLPDDLAMTVILSAEAMAALQPMVASGAMQQLYDREPWETKWASYTRLGLRADDYPKAAYVRAAVQRAYHALFEHHDVIVSGGWPIVAPEIDHFDGDFDGGSWGSMSTSGNLAGLPALTLPMAFSGGMPLSLHAIAAPYEDARLFELGTALQARTDHHKKRPPNTT